MVPEQIQSLKGSQEYSIRMISVEDAEELFIIAKNRMLDVNNWHKLAGTNLAAFELADKHGKAIHRHAHLHDYIKVNGLQQVFIDHIDYDDYPDINDEAISMSLKPGAAYTEEASICILKVERLEDKVKASYIPAINENLIAGIQWNILLKALLDFEEE